MSFTPPPLSILTKKNNQLILQNIQQKQTPYKQKLTQAGITLTLHRFKKDPKKLKELRKEILK